jgi:hypothetical protein
MKKLWVMAFGTAFLLQTASLYAADIKFEGDFRVRGIYADDLDADEDTEDQQAFGDGRFRLRTTATAGITTAVVTMDFTNAFNDPNNLSCPDGGGPTGADACATGNYRFGSANFGGSYNIFGMREAYLRLDLDRVKLAFGRKMFKLGHSLILDDTMDAIAVKFMVGPLDVLLADGKLVESNALGVPGNTGSDSDLYLAKAGFKHGDGHELGIFVTYLNDRDRSLLGVALLTPPGTPGDATLWTLGVTADGKFGPINLGAEIDFLNGEISNGTTTDLAGLNILVGVGLKVAAVDVGVTGLYTTGDDATDAGERNVNGISGNFVLGNILVNDNINSDREGQCASVGGGRIGSGGAGCFAGLGVTGLKVSAGLEGVPFGKTCHTEVAAIWAQTTEDPVGPGGAGDSDLGIEIDLNHRHKLDDNVAVAVNLGYLLSGDAWQTIGTGDDNQVKGIISLNYMF